MTPFLIRDLLQESLNMKITIETLDFKIFKGRVKEIDDFMNIILEEEGRDLFIRGSKIRLIRIPDILKYSPVIKKN
ncbi:Small nuclear ribonucleoprotein Sm D3 [Nosema bombycis CQ1]|uniref:Small nuclear ribonucleoprotein Sm D3 n=1 Tax=Nosema bombycis (strain CQ1 / CVCC 102059) TaxID=578461 RepID=R0MQ10_NOSB1|nr:Small nuclear ribonucleoprotein Sm D3 [Nosema bombycis CQ1]|eukprot:EOB14943.1 Small nuclear ribonucleoprotein Sm D3 [Nosema bombycis CQ1]